MTVTLCSLLLSVLTFVELNCENLFDTRHDSLRNDTEFLPDGSYHWTPWRYWRKVNRVAQTVLACTGDTVGAPMPDLVALCEVENDSVMFDLTRRSLLRGAGYEYIMTDSPDRRGIDVALMYSPFAFAPVSHRSVTVTPPAGFEPTRDILYVCGRIVGGDTLHVIVAHLPSRRGGERQSRPLRKAAAACIAHLVDSVMSVSPQADIIVAGDMNEYSGSAILSRLCANALRDVSEHATGTHGAKATYRYQGRWGSLDHILASHDLAAGVERCYVVDLPFLLEEDTKYGGVKPKRNYYGPIYHDGFSDHLPLVAIFRLPQRKQR